MTGNRTHTNSDRLLGNTRRSASLIRGTVLRITLGALVFGSTASAIAGDSSKADHDASRLSTSAKLRHWFQTGQASWYGLKFQGRKTANGEAFNMNGYTCAHRDLPLGSWLRVTNLRNRKTVLVRVNDRGPMIDSRIIDLSYAAAHAVGLSGVGKVGIEVVAPSDPEIARVVVAQLPAPEFSQFIGQR